MSSREAPPAHGDRAIAEAIAAQHAGDTERAKALCETLLHADARHPGALQLLGVIAQEAGDLIRARALMEQSVSAAPEDARAHFNLAVVRSLQGDTHGAIAAYESAVGRAPDFAPAHSNLGNLYARIGRYGDALRAHAAAMEAQPDFAPAYSNVAAVLVTLGAFEQAVHVLETAVRRFPPTSEAYANLGQAYRGCGRRHDALAAAARALDLRPDFAAYLTLSLEAFESGAFDIALDANLRALAIDPASAGALCNCATVYVTTGRYPEAIAAARAAIALSPDYAEAHVNLALALLVSGDFAAGWDEYAWTWRLPSRRPSYPFASREPVWNGDDFAGRSLLITREQGFGDAIFAARYLPAVKARGGRVVFEAAPVLVPLFTGLAGIDELRVSSEVGTVWNDVDLHVPVLGLPRAFATRLATIPAAVPYLRAPDARRERWDARLRAAPGLRVGIVWAGSAAHVDDRHRSVRLDDFAPLGAIDGISWFGLQKGRDEDRRACGPLTLDPLGPEIGDFADTAAILTHLDLLIAVDTSVVHLAGALARPVWTLLPFAPDWRWLLDRADSPWYPTMRLFRQRQAGDWSAVFGEVADELGRYVRSAAKRSRT